MSPLQADREALNRLRCTHGDEQGANEPLPLKHDNNNEHGARSWCRNRTNPIVALPVLDVRFLEFVE